MSRNDSWEFLNSSTPADAAVPFTAARSMTQRNAGNDLDRKIWGWAQRQERNWNAALQG